LRGYWPAGAVVLPVDFAAAPGASWPAVPGGLVAVDVPFGGIVLIVPFVVPVCVRVVEPVVPVDEPDDADGLTGATLDELVPGVVVVLGEVVCANAAPAVRATTAAVANHVFICDTPRLFQ
jgi:hypothetical protein